jgi:hypothetical protein
MVADSASVAVDAPYVEQAARQEIGLDAALLGA